MECILQRCKQCGNDLQLSQFYANPSYTSGHESTCKSCKLAYAARRLAVKGTDIRAYHRRHYAENREAKCTYHKDYRASHAEAIRERKRQHYAAHRESLSERSKEKRALTPTAAIRAANQKRYAAHKEHIGRHATEYKAKDPQRWKRYGAAWRRAHPEYCRVKDSARRAQLKGVGGSHTKEQLRELSAQQNGRCAACGVDISEKVHSDHIMPIKLGGSNDISNIQLLCPRCNLRKNAKHPDVWKRELLRK